MWTCDKYTHLCFKTQRNRRTEIEILSGIVKRELVTDCPDSILWSTKMSHKRKRQICNAFLISILIYVLETWQLVGKHIPLAAEMDSWRKSAGISRLDRNKRDGEIMEIKKTILDEAQRLQLFRYGLVQRMVEQWIPRKLLNWASAGRKRRGYPKAKWIGNVEQAVEAKFAPWSLHRYNGVEAENPEA